jgi:anti-anti-sigma factor
MDAFAVSVTRAEAFCLVKVAGKLDLTTAPLLHSELERVSGDVVIDCSELTFADSSGIAEFLILVNRVDSVTLTQASNELRQLVETLGLNEVLRPGEQK